MIYLTYSGSQNDYKMEFSIRQENSEKPEVIIDRFPRVRILKNSNWASPKSSPDELRNAADMSDEMDGFLIGKFGKSVGERGNGCPLYQTQVPEEYTSKGQ